MTVKDLLALVIEQHYDLDTELRVAKGRTTREITITYRDDLRNRPHKFLEVNAKWKE